MPKVGKMKFPYTKRGMEDAKSYASQSGKQLEVEGYRGGGLIPKYQRGGMIPRRLGMRPRPGIGGRMNPRILQALANRFKKGGKVKK